MQILLSEQEYNELKAKEFNHEFIKKIELAAQEYVIKNGCNVMKEPGYCGNCPLEDMPHYNLDFPYCIAGKYREWPK